MVTDSWLKSLWEKADRFGITLTDSVVEIQMPWEDNNWLMLTLAESGHSMDELICLNWVRLHQQALFVSDMLDSSGSLLEKKYLHQWKASEKWLSCLFLHQSPPWKDFKLWHTALQGVRG